MARRSSGRPQQRRLHTVAAHIIATSKTRQRTQPCTTAAAAARTSGARGAASVTTAASTSQGYAGQQQQRTVMHKLLTAAQWAHYSREGYVAIDGILPSDLVCRLTAAALRLRDRVRAGELHHGFIHRTGITAPGLPTGQLGGLGEPWDIRGVYSPEHNEPVFAEYFAHPRLLCVTTAWPPGTAAAPIP